MGLVVALASKQSMCQDALSLMESSFNDYQQDKNQVPGHVMGEQGNIMASQDISHEAVILAEIEQLVAVDRDLRACLLSLSHRWGARAMRAFLHEDGELRELVGWPSSAAPPRVSPGLRERLLEPRTRSRVRVLGSKSWRVWEAVLPETREAPLVLELVVDARLLGLVVVEADPSWPRDDASEAGARFEPLLAALALRFQLFARERQLARLQDQLEQRTKQRLDHMTFDADRHEIVGASGGLRQVMERVELVAGSDVPVLLFGETGSGKEVIARAIHEASPRHREPFIRVNCGAIPPELIDSQLFGHERGSFTGATEQRKGWFERASGGTLFLDEVGELPLAAQVRLLRVLQDHSFERVGGQTAVACDCRIVAATHRDLPAMVQAGGFREDLWYRLAVFPLVIPPLRERPLDIPPLARFFARRAVRFGLPPCVPSDDDLALLLAYDWPGNVRELAAVIDRAAILGRGRKLDIETALGAVRLDETRTRETAASLVPASVPSRGRASLVSLDEAMRGHIETVLTACEGRIEGPRGAARVLDINPHTLRSRMRKLGLDWQRFRPNE